MPNNKTQEFEFKSDAAKFLLAEKKVLETQEILKSIYNTESNIESGYIREIYKEIDKLKALEDKGVECCFESSDLRSFITGCKDFITDSGITNLMNKIKETFDSLNKIESFKFDYLKALEDFKNQENEASEKFFEVLYEKKFSDFSDFEYNRMGVLSKHFNNHASEYEKHIGEKVFDVDNIFSDYGFADFYIREVVRDVHGNPQILILQDGVSGDYLFVFSPTINPENVEGGFVKKYEDVIYDASLYVGLDKKNLPEISTVNETLLKYYEKTVDENVKINFYGYSKGAGLAEYSYLSLKFFERKYDCLGEIVVYNPYHFALDSTGVYILKESGDLTVYRHTGDLMSTYFNEHDFDTETIYIDCDWVSKYNIIEDNQVNDKISYIDSDISLFVSNMGNENWKYLFLGGAHSPESYSPIAFDENGMSIYNKDSYLYRPGGEYNGRDIWYYIYGITDPSNLLEIDILK